MFLLENNLTIDTNVTLSPIQNEIHYLPPCNRNAGSVEEVYKVYDLLSAEIMDSLDVMVSNVMKDDVIQLAQDSRYVIRIEAYNCYFVKIHVLNFNKFITDYHSFSSKY